MALPKIKTPIYDVYLPYTKKEIQFRPFLVKEEKILAMAFEGDDPKEMTRAMKQIINNCCLTENFDVDKLPIFELEFLFLKLRSKSVNNISELQFRCKNLVEDKECNTIIKYTLNLDEINLPKKDISNEIKLTKDLTVVFNYPTIDLVNLFSSDEDKSDLIINMIVSCIDYFYDNETTYRDFKKEEAKELIQSLTLNDFKKLEQFFQDIPTLSHEDVIQCPKCKYDQIVNFNGLKDFF
jgi:hypothetical protein